MRRWVFVVAAILGLCLIGVPAWADGPSGSTECHLQDDDCDGAIDEDLAGDPDGDGNADDDGDGSVDEDLTGDAANDPGENQVSCGGGTDVAGAGYVYAGSDGAEVCADESSTVTPIDGRVIVDADDGYVAIDGDNNNPGASNGYARVDDSGVHCGDETNLDSGADQTGNEAADCG